MVPWATQGTRIKCEWQGSLSPLIGSVTTGEVLPILVNRIEFGTGFMPKE